MITADHASASASAPPPESVVMNALNHDTPAGANDITIFPARTAILADLPKGPFRLGDCRIDPAEGSVRRPGRPAEFVDPKLMQLLLQLAASPRQLVTRRVLLDAIWYSGADCDCALTRLVSKLRRVLGDKQRPPTTIQTIHGRGYRLMIEPVADDAGLPSAVDDTGSTGDDAARSEKTRDMASFFAELRRRRVFRVASAYLVIGWLVVQVGETVFDPLGVPEWCLTALVVTVILGFPMAIAMAWAVQLTNAGAVLEIPIVTPKTPDRRARSAPRNFLITAGLLLLIGIFSYGVVMTDTTQPVAGDVCVSQTFRPGPDSSQL